MEMQEKVGSAICVVFFLILIILTFTGWIPDYSDGTRVGVVDKISEKGMFNKSFEGDLRMAGFINNQQGQLVPKIFHFSVRDPKVAEQITTLASQGVLVTLHYKEWLFPPKVQQGTGYTVTAVTPVTVVK